MRTANTIILLLLLVLSGGVALAKGGSSPPSRPAPVSRPAPSNIGRSGKQERLKQIGQDPKVSSRDRGWIKQEQNNKQRGKENKVNPSPKRKSIRNPPGKDLAHERGREAAKGYDYSHAHLQDRATHRTQHKLDDKGRRNKERPVSQN